MSSKHMYRVLVKAEVGTSIDNKNKGLEETVCTFTCVTSRSVNMTAVEWACELLSIQSFFSFLLCEGNLFFFNIKDVA